MKPATQVPGTAPLTATAYTGSDLPVAKRRRPSGSPHAWSKQTLTDRQAARLASCTATRRDHRLSAFAADDAVLSKPSTPAWAGASILSRLLNLAFSIPALSTALKQTAKTKIISEAEQKGVPWQQTVADLQGSSQVYELEAMLRNAALHYPQYYLQEFHAYPEGNLGWLPAFEAEPATDLVAVRSLAQKGLSPAEAQQQLRNSINRAIQEYITAYDACDPGSIVDLGCGVGISSRSLAEHFASAQSVLGIDLSPFFLAVAELRRREAPQRSWSWSSRTSYRHGLCEATELPDASVDLVNASFLVHECTAEACAEIVREARRVLRPGGILALTDNDPGSQVLKEMNVMMVLRKITEPWADQFYMLDQEALLRDNGFQSVQCRGISLRHRVVLGQAV
ncbi:hypothetical protein WJX73_005647 [Symbiochloris irregularis]|uniref:Methyltransferase type 11 domain-containing protein n=1 Tax=Symbiochloris irregularis TaxID=706552 RepID=A0AAW1PZM9_9CHLO